MFQKDLDLRHGMVDIAQGRLAMAAEVVLGLLYLMVRMLQFDKGVVQVREMGIFLVLLLQVRPCRFALDVVPRVFQDQLNLLDRVVDRREPLFLVAAEVVLGIFELLAGVAQLPKRMMQVVMRVLLLARLRRRAQAEHDRRNQAPKTNAHDVFSFYWVKNYRMWPRHYSTDERLNSFVGSVQFTKFSASQRASLSAQLAIGTGKTFVNHACVSRYALGNW